MGALKRNAVLIAIFAMALSLRSYHLSTYPRHNQTADEYAWTWAGLTMVTKGVPRSWSWLPPYHNGEMKHWRGNEYRIVTPWLDHPPLFPLLMGGWMRSLGYKDPFWVDLWTMRIASLALFVITFWLLAAVLARMTDRRTMHLTLLVYAVCPLAVFNSRLVVAENLFVPIHLALLYALLRSERARWLPAMGLGALALPLTKVAAAGVSLHLVVVAWIRQRRAAAAVIAAATLCGVLVYWWYARRLGGPELFAAIVGAHRERFVGFEAFWQLLFNPKIVDDHVPYLLLLLGLCTLIGDGCSNLEWVLLIAIYGMTIAFLADGSMVRSWYLIPLYPALSFGVAVQIGAMWDEDGARHKWIWVAFATPTLCAELVAEHGDRVRWVRYAYLAAVAISGALFVLMPRTRRIAHATTAVLVAATLVGDVAFVLSR